MSKLKGKIVTEVLSGRKGIVIAKKKKNWIVRIWVPEQTNWFTVKMPREEFQLGHQEEKKIGF